MYQALLAHPLDKLTKNSISNLLLNACARVKISPSIKLRDVRFVFIQFIIFFYYFFFDIGGGGIQTRDHCSRTQWLCHHISWYIIVKSLSQEKNKITNVHS